ncbi:MAG: lysophospholipid acyltransferase [Gammaproteobacteria bacterium]|nr:lysophospholipid acyltransferase [Gammaproteobacteria bacterium]
MQRLLKSLLEHLATYGILAFLGALCLAWALIALLSFPLLPRRWGTVFGRFGIMGGFRLFAWTLELSGAYRLDLTALDALGEGPPVLLAPNHPSLIDAPLILTCHPNVACVMKTQLMNNVFLGAGARLARYIRSGQPRMMIKESIAELGRGSSVLLFPEGTRSTRLPVNRLTSSIGVISKHARVPVQVLIVETDSPYLSKGWALFRVPSLPITYRVRLGRRFDPPTDVPAFMDELDREFVQQLAGAPQAAWLVETNDPPDNQLIQTE